MKILKDYRRYSSEKKGKLENMIGILLYPGFITILIFRLADFIYRKNKKFYFISKILMLIPRVLFGIDISVGAEIGEGFCIGHGCGLVIGSFVRIGKNCSVAQQVTLGGNFGKEGIYKGIKISQPVLEDNCFVGPGAKLLGPVILGENSIVGANVVIINKSYDKNSKIIK